MFCGDVIMNMKKMGIILGTTLIALQAGTAQADFLRQNFVLIQSKKLRSVSRQRFNEHMASTALFHLVRFLLGMGNLIK